VADFFTICVTINWRDGWRIATFTFWFYISKFLLSGWFCEKRQLNLTSRQTNPYIGGGPLVEHIWKIDPPIQIISIGKSSVGFVVVLLLRAVRCLPGFVACSIKSMKRTYHHDKAAERRCVACWVFVEFRSTPITLNIPCKGRKALTI